jgi:gamma-glutamylcyclotransferase
VKYFAYGSNMLNERLKARVSSAKNPRPFTLRRYRLRFHKKSSDCSGKCNIVATASDGDLVHGVLFDINEAQISSLDKAEGVVYGYRRNEIVVSIDDIMTKIFVYIAEEDAIDDALVPYRWYYELVLSGAEQHALPSDYVAGLRAIPFTNDPKPDRKSRLEALDALRKYAESKKMT